MSQACPPGTVVYVIRPGDTYYSLARRFNTTVPAIVSANPLVNPNALQIGQSICIPLRPIFPPCPEGNYYTIKAGDTLYSLVRFFRVSLDDLLEANPYINPNSLGIGQVICIPVATPPVTCGPGTFTYTIQPGDTLYSLARRFNTTVVSIIGLNPGINPTGLLIGERICILHEA
jgi:LysM repeat protein